MVGQNKGNYEHSQHAVFFKAREIAWIILAQAPRLVWPWEGAKEGAVVTEKIPEWKDLNCVWCRCVWRMREMAKPWLLRAQDVLGAQRTGWSDWRWGLVMWSSSRQWTFWWKQLLCVHRYSAGFTSRKLNQPEEEAETSQPQVLGLQIYSMTTENLYKHYNWIGLFCSEDPNERKCHPRIMEVARAHSHSPSGWFP